jgi:hypothetical protein
MPLGVQSLTKVFDSRRSASAVGFLLSVVMALSLWASFGLAKNSTPPTEPEVSRSVQTEDGQPVRLGAEVELKEDHEGSSPLDAEVCMNRDLLVFAPISVCQAWGVEVRSLVSQRIREGHGARGPPQA